MGEMEVGMSAQEFINIAPDKQGYATMAAMFGENIIGQVAKGERENMTALLGAVINIAAHLGNAAAQDDADAVAAYEWLAQRFPSK